MEKDIDEAKLTRILIGIKEKELIELKIKLKEVCPHPKEYVKKHWTSLHDRCLLCDTDFRLKE